MVASRRLSLILAGFLVSGLASAGERRSLDISSSQIIWTGKKPTGSHSGIIPIKEGFIEIDKGNLVGGEIIFDMKGIRSTDRMSESWKRKLDNHLKSDDFFSVSSYPIASYKIEALKCEAVHCKILGYLTIKNVTKKVEADVKFTGGHSQPLIDADFKLDRTRWNLKHMSKYSFDSKKIIDGFIYDDVAIHAHLQTSIDGGKMGRK